MPITLYRAENSTPHEIQARGGFRARVPLLQATARDLINRCNGNAGAQIVIALPPPADTSPLQRTLNLQTPQNLGALMQNIKLEKNQSTVHISCDSEIACGGYDGYVYQMTFPNLNYQANGAGAVVAAATANDFASQVTPRLVFDGPNLGASQYIAVAKLIVGTWVNSRPAATPQRPPLRSTYYISLNSI